MFILKAPTQTRDNVLSDKKKKCLPTLPSNFQTETLSTDIFLFGLIGFMVYLEHNALCKKIKLRTPGGFFTVNFMFENVMCKVKHFFRLVQTWY